MQEKRGCEEDTKEIVLVYGGKALKRCPVASLTPFTLFALRLYAHYAQGFLPEIGGTLNQNNRYLVAVEVVSDTVETLQQRKREQERKKAERKTKAGYKGRGSFRRKR